MCGFVGILPENNKKFKDFKNLVNSFHHRGPDDTQIYEDNNIQLGFKRLSIIDLTNGAQPFFSKDRRYVMVFNGEIYNFNELKSELKSLGVKFNTNSDTEVLLESYIFWGKSFLEKINGMFAFAIYDFNLKKLLLVRDRFGIKPLYFYHKNNFIIFASEIKTLIISRTFDHKVNYDGVSSYLSFRYPYGVGTFFKNISKVNPGEYIEFEKSNITKKIYWELPKINELEKKRSEKSYVEELDFIMNNVTKDHLISDVSIGSLLSGGLDSSLITSIMGKYQKNFNTFSASFDSSEYDESKFASIVSNHIGTKHSNIVLDSSDYFRKLEDIIEHKYQPLTIPHEVALYDLFKEIKKKNKVVISGEGADEMFGGYGRVMGSGFDYNKILYFNKIKNNAVKEKIYQIFGMKDYYSENISSRKDQFFKIYNWFSIEQKKEIFTEEFNNFTNNDESVHNFWENEFEKIKNINEDNKFIYLFQKFHLQCLLDRLDLMSMASGVESRVPFCDYRIVNFLSKVPYKYKIKWNSTFSKARALFSTSDVHSEALNTSKFLLRKLSKKYLPEVIVNRKKLGFPTPLDQWVSNEKIKYVKEILLDSKTKNRGIFNMKNLEKLINNKENLKYDFWGKKVWMLLNLEIWFRKVSP
jgi:asparagine synthase (glutamine-hydrolysing)